MTWQAHQSQSFRTPWNEIIWHHTSHFRGNHGKLRVWPRDAKGLCYTCRGSLRCNPSLLGSPSLGKRFACTVEICRSRPHRAPRRGCLSDLTMRLLRFATCLGPCYREPPAVSSHLWGPARLSGFSGRGKMATATTKKHVSVWTLDFAWSCWMFFG